jgi:hypothetical protein
VKNPPWSYSALSTFEQCPKKYYHLRIAKDVKDEDSEDAAEGRAVHEALYARVVKGTPLPLPMRVYERMALKFISLPGTKSGELKLALNENLEPTGFFAKDVWVRAVADLVIDHPSGCVIVDWKTGKQKDSWDQLVLSAAVLAQHMPEADNFRLVYAWLRDGQCTGRRFTRAELLGTWSGYIERVNKMYAAGKTTNFPARSSRLCGWCPVKQCPHWFDRSER